jgi:hypothetical protein
LIPKCPELARQPPFEHQKKIIGFIVLVPDEFAFDLHDHDRVAVEFGDRAWRPIILEQTEFVFEIGALVHGLYFTNLYLPCKDGSQSACRLFIVR